MGTPCTSTFWPNSGVSLLTQFVAAWKHSMLPPLCISETWLPFLAPSFPPSGAFAENPQLSNLLRPWCSDGDDQEHMPDCGCWLLDAMQKPKFVRMTDNDTHRRERPDRHTNLNSKQTLPTNLYQAASNARTKWQTQQATECTSLHLPVCPFAQNTRTRAMLRQPPANAREAK